MLRSAALLTAFLVTPPVCAADGYGDVRGRFVLVGEVPVLPPLIAQGDTTVKDSDVCAVSSVPDESLVIDRDGNVANVVLFPVERPSKIHPDLLEPPKMPVTFEAKQCQFVPHILRCRAGQPIVLTSSGNAAYSIRTSFINNLEFSNKPHWFFVLSPNGRENLSITLSKPEVLPLPIRCDIHPCMGAYWLVCDHPYTAVSGADGMFAIEKLPAGKHSFVIWHETSGYLDRGFEVEVTANDINDIGDLRLELMASEDDFVLRIIE